MDTTLGSQTPILTDHPAGLGDHLIEPAWVGGEIPPSLGGFWRCLATDRPGTHLEIPPLLAGIPGGPAGIIHVGRAPSSQYRAVRDHLAGGGALTRPMICLADAGVGFTGQSGRVWHAESGNLHLTLALPCDLAAGPEAVALTALPAVAVHRALAALQPDPARPGPGIKWVNDILLDGGKVAGVLTAVRSQGGRLTSVVLGIGINVGSVPDLEPSPFTPAPVSVASVWPAATPSLAMVLSGLLAEIERAFLVLTREGAEPILAAYREGSIVGGRRVGIWPVDTPDEGPTGAEPPERTGIVTGILPDLSLKLEGQDHPVTSGRLALLDGHRTLS